MRSFTIELPSLREPWLISLRERISLVYKAKYENKKVCIMIYHHADTSTFRYRCYNVFQWTRDSDQWQAVYFFHDEISAIFDLIPKVDLLSLVRLQWFQAVDMLILKAHSYGVPVIYDVDDNVFDLELLPLLGNSIDVDFSVEGQYDYWFSYISRNGFTASKVDGFTTTNEYLGEMLNTKFGKKYSIIRNSLNKEQLDVSKRCREEKSKGSNLRTTSKDDDALIIGYFSGSPSHNRDFQMIAPELAAFLDDYPKAQLEVVGFMEFPPILQAASKRKQIHVSSLTDFLNLQVLTAQVDVSIIPLLENRFTNCKSELKFFEAGVVDTISIASPIYSYAHCINHGKNGYLCQVGQWYTTLQIVNSERELMNKIQKQAETDSLDWYSGNTVICEIENAFNSFIE